MAKSSGQNLILGAAGVLLLFTVYMTVQTEMLHSAREKGAGTHQHLSRGEAWIASLPDKNAPPSSESSQVQQSEPQPQARPVILKHDTAEVRADKAGGGGHPKSMAAPALDLPPPEWLAFIGVFTYANVGGIARRNTVRKAWFPATRAELEKFEVDNKVKLRFVMGKTKDGIVPAEVQQEEKEFGEHLHLDLIEEYQNLKLKMLKYFRDTMSLYRAEYYLKVDDDIFFRPDRVPLAAPQWKARQAGFVGCFRKGGTMFAQPDNRYFDPQRFLIHQEKYYLYAAGPTMALSLESCKYLAAVPDKGLRFWGAGDASVGAWMLAFNITHHEEHRLCHNRCEFNTIGYYDTTKCNGLCKPSEQIPQLMKEQCGAEPTIPKGYDYLPESKLFPWDNKRERCAKLHADWLDQSDCHAPLRRN